MWGGILMQSFKALELSVKDKSWAIASQLEVTSRAVGLATEEERLLSERG